MKVALNETVEVSDDQLRLIADLIDGKESRRLAKRAEARAFLWRNGEDWAERLKAEHIETFDATPEPDEDDLI
jgi:hypothetical protein